MSNIIQSRPWTESERIAALAKYAILDTPQEKAFDDVVKLVSQLLNAPIAAVNLIDKGRQWFKSEIGLGVREMPLDDSICRFAILQEDLMIIPDTLEDPRFNCNPFVTGTPGLRFYAGELLKTPDGLPLGTLCVLDTKPRPEGLTEEQQFALQTLAHQVVSQLELRKLVHEQNTLLAEQKQTAAALRVEHERSQQLLQRMDEGFILLDEDFHIQEINAGALKMENRPASDIIGRSYWEAWPGSENLPIAQAFKQAMHNRSPAELEQRYVFPDGRIVWVDVHAYPVPSGLAVFYRNITERKRSEALAEGQRKALEMAVTGTPLQAVLDVLTRFAEEQLDDAARISVLLLDHDARRLHHGAAPSLPREYINAIDGIAIGPAVGSCGTAAYRNQEVIVSDIENDPLWRDFKELAFVHDLRSCWSQPIRSPQGTVMGTLACYWNQIHVPTETEKESLALLVSTAALILDHRREIDERKASQEMLRRNAERFQSFVTATSQIVWTTNAEGYVVEDSPTWRAFTGQTYDEWKNQGWMDAIHPDDKAQTISSWSSSLARQQVFETEYRVRKVDGTYRWTAVRGVPVLNQDGSIREWVGANTDITERKQAEDELRRLAAHLSEANHRKTEFLATLAHELRNPLAPLRNGLEVLRLAGSNQATAAKVQDMMQRQLNHMVQLINDLLDVARISSGKVELKKEIVKLNTLITSAVEFSLPLIDAAHHTLDVNISDDSLELHADPTRMVQIIGNLLTNAAKYTPDGGRITLTVQKQDREVAIVVSDTGIGIPKEALPSLFEMFSQVSNNMERTQGGLGIGLALVQRLVELHGGTVTAASPGEGKGSTFTIRLPLVISGKDRVLSEHVQDSYSHDKNGNNLRIVIADDNVDAADSLATVLQLEGHDTSVAHDGYSALKKAVEVRPEVIFLDIGMPGMTGYEVAKEIRKTPGMEATILVALTGWGAQHDQAMAREAGFHHHLTKPADWDAINNILLQAYKHE